MSCQSKRGVWVRYDPNIMLRGLGKRDNLLGKMTVEEYVEWALRVHIKPSIRLVPKRKESTDGVS